MAKVPEPQPLLRAFRPRLSAGELLAIERSALDVEFLFPSREAVTTRWLESGVAIVNVRGPLEQHAGCGWDSYADILARVEAAMAGCETAGAAEGDESPPPGGARPPAKAVVLDVDSPGGLASGSMYVHRRLRALRAEYGCPIYGYANETANSAAYAIISACDEVWLPDTGVVGSIGVIATLFDRTVQNEKLGTRIELVTSGEYKGDGHADRPLTDGIRARMQSRVDAFAGVFFSIVAEARGTSPKAVAALEAAVFVGEAAVDVGVADGTAAWDEFLELVSASVRNLDEDGGQPAAAQPQRAAE